MGWSTSWVRASGFISASFNAVLSSRYNPEWLGTAGLNFLTHGLTFVLNTLIVRMVQTNVFGVRTLVSLHFFSSFLLCGMPVLTYASLSLAQFASVPLQLLVSTILFLSREAFRNACQRSAEGEYFLPLRMLAPRATVGLPHSASAAWATSDGSVSGSAS